MVGEIPHILKTTDAGETVLAPERFKNSSEVREVCQGMIRADRPRSSERAIVDGQADGHPCYSLAKLKAKNQGWRARTNHRGLEGKLQELSNIFFDLNTEVDPAIRVFIDYGKGEETVRWQECIAKNYTRMLLQQWSGFDYHIPMRDNVMLRHGLGAHVWPIKGRWEPRTPAAGHLLFPENTSVDFNGQGESFLLREFTPAHVLYGYVKNEESARKSGWNPEAVWEVLKQSSKSGTTIDSPEEYQRSLRNADYGTSMTRQSGVWLNYLFIVEVGSKKISQYCVAESIETKDYLLKRRNYFDGFEDVITLFPYEIPASGLLHSIRGFGARSHVHYDTLNKVYNAMTDNVLLSMYPQFSQTAQTDPEKLKLMRIGAMTIYPQGVTPQTLNLPNLAQGGIPLSQILNASINENNQTYLAGTPEPKDRETALSFQMRAQDSSRVSKATHSLYYRNVTRFHKKCLYTALKPNGSNESWAVLAREFRERCIKDGVPEAAFTRIVDVESMRSVGAGSVAQRLQSLMLLKENVYPNASEDRKIAWERDVAAVAAGYSQVDRYARSTEDANTPNNDDTIISLENAALMQGEDVVANSGQDHVKHGQGHLARASEIVQAVEQGELGAEQALAAIQSIGRHTAQHVQALDGNPLRKAEFDGLMQELMALGQIAEQLQQQIAEEQEMAEQQQAVSDGLQIGLAKVEADSQVKQAKFQHDAALKEAKLQRDTRLKFGQAAANTRIATFRAQAEVQNKRLTAGAKQAA